MEFEVHAAQIVSGSAGWRYAIQTTVYGNLRRTAAMLMPYERRRGLERRRYRGHDYRHIAHVIDILISEMEIRLMGI